MHKTDILTNEDKEKIAKKNSKVFLIDGMMFQFGMSFIDASSVISVFIFLLTNSASLSGLAQVCFMVGITGGNILWGSKLSKIKSIPKFMAKQVIFARLFLFLAFGLLFLGMDEGLYSVFFILLYFISFFVHGATVAPWQDIYSRTMTDRYRSTVMGYRQSMGALVSILASVIIQRVLSINALDYKMQYGIVILIGTAILTICAIPLSLIKETERPITDQNNNEGVLNLLKRAPGILKAQKPFSNFLTVRILDTVVMSVITFLIIASKDILGLTTAQVGIIVIMRTVGRTVGGFFSGWLSKKFGNKTVILTRTALLLLLSIFGVVLCLYLRLPVYFAYIFSVTAGVADAAMLGHMLYNMYSMKAKARPDCIILDSLVRLPFSFASFFWGLMIDAAGYLAYFIVSGVLVVVTLILAIIKLLPKEEFDKITE